MTNFQADLSAKARLITPERALVVLPVIAGIVVASLLAVFGVAPQLVRLQQRQQELSDRQRQQAELPQLRAQLNVLLNRTADLKAQQLRLVDLIGGATELRTLLTQLNTLAAGSGITLLTIEPQPVERGVKAAPQKPPTESNTKPDEKAPPPPPVDKLLPEGLEKHSALITLQGPFTGIVQFLQLLESLAVIVLVEDLDVEATDSGGQSLTKAKLLLSAYGRVAPAASGAASVPEPASAP